MRHLKEHILGNVIHSATIRYPTPVNLTNHWDGGNICIDCNGNSTHNRNCVGNALSPEINLAFISVEHIMRDVNYGWLLRYIHANGASFFFIVVISIFSRPYIIILINIHVNNYGLSGVAILLIMIITAFLGYVLPWGSNVFLGVRQLLTNLFSAITIYWLKIVIWLWGGFQLITQH
jgi:quinol-cytochrome oxidoreductase complex cytochrome b subunit